MFCKIAILDTKAPTPAGQLDAAEWTATRNGGTKRLTTFVGDEGAATIQLERVQNNFAVFRRVLARVPIAGTNQTLVALYQHGKGWTYKVRENLTNGPKLFNHTPRTYDVEARPVAPGIANLRRLVVPCYATEGQFLDWLAYKSPYGWEVDTIHDLSETQAAQILAGYAVGK